MKKYYYDLHLHSCLSPCGDDDNTPNNIAGMAKLCGLDIIALTDHNSAKNCPAFFKAAERYDLIPVAGMELTTAEDIHVVCLFERLDDALRFDEYINSNRAKIKNRPEIFGNQSILDENDHPIDEIDYLLINATTIPLSNVKNEVVKFGGVCFPAHIDREANGIIAVLGSLPEDIPFDYYELHDKETIEHFCSEYKIDRERFLICSDAHYLTDIRDKENYLQISDKHTSHDEIRTALFEILRRPR